MRTLILTAALIAMTFLFYGSSKQEEPYRGDIIICTACRGTWAFYDPVEILERYKQYFIEKRIRVFVDSTTYKCGFILKGDGRTKFVDAKIADLHLVSECENFYGHWTY